MTKQVAVIILNWNGAALLREFLPSVVAHTPTELADVIVADNGSTDDSLKVLTEEFPTVKVLAFDKNYGFAEGYNRALDMTRYPFTVLLNSDVAVKNDWLTPLYHFMLSRCDAGACQPKLLSYKKPGEFEYAGAAGGFIDRHGYPYCRGRLFGDVETDNGQYDDTVEVDWATGAALMVRTDAYLDCGGLDAGFFAHMEEIDLCWRMRLKGFTVWAVGSSAVYHLGGGSLPASNPRKTYLNFRNNLLMLRKNLPQKGRGRALFVRRLLDSLAWAKFVASGQWGNAKAVLKAHSDYRRMAADGPVRAESNLLDGRPDLLWSYYVKGVRRFSDF